VGDTRDVKVDVRLIAASNRDLAKAVADGVLREDLYYRLNVIPIHMPPLRERIEDIPLLVAHFIARITHDVGKSVRGISPESLAILERYHWPGNIRELENIVERAIVLGSGEILAPESLPPHLRAPRDERTLDVDIPPTGMNLEDTLARIESRYIRLALERSDWLQVRAAELLGLSFRQFRYKLQKHGLRGGRQAPKPPAAD
jgi:DNA-binding NtrC family response regulator